MPRVFPLFALLAGLVAGVPSSAVWAQAADKPVLAFDAGGHTAVVWKAMFSPDGREVITVSDDKTVRCWDVLTGEPLRVLRPPIGKGDEGRLYAGAVSPDGRYVAVGGYGRPDDNYGNIYLISLVDSRLERVLVGHESVIYSLDFSGDSRWLVSSSDADARIWNVATGECKHILRGHTEMIRGVAFSPTNDLVATVSRDKTAKLWSVASGTVVTELKGHTQPLHAVSFSRDGRRVATGGYDRKARVFSTGGTLIRSFDVDADWIMTTRFSPDGEELLYTCGGQGFSKRSTGIFSMRTGAQRVEFTEHTNSVFEGAFSPDGRLVVTTGGSDNETFLWRPATGERVHKLMSKGRANWAVAWNPEGDTVSWGSVNIGSAVNEAKALERSFNFRNLELKNQVDNVTWRRAQESRGSVAASVKADAPNTIQISRLGRGVGEWVSPARGDQIQSFTLLKDEYVVVGSWYGLYLADARTGAHTRDFYGHGGMVSSLSASPDGRLFATASNDMTVRIWNPGHNEPLVSLFVAGDEWVAWSPEGFYASSPGGERLMGWHINNGPDKLATYYPSAQYRKTFYNPDLIRELLPSGSLEAAKERLGGKLSEESIEEARPPIVAITVPREGKVAVKEPLVEIRAVAQSTTKHPITEMQLLVDGRPYTGEGGKKNIGRERQPLSASETWKITLAPGLHEIKVKAATSASYGLSDPVLVTYEEEAELPTLHVLAIGVAKYNDAKLALDFPAKDARAVADAFSKNSQQLFRQVKTTVLTDEQATRKNILTAVRSFQQSMTQRDFGVLFFSGHGVKDNDGIFYLAPVEIEASDVTFTGVAQEEIKRYCERTPGKLVVMLDACHAGSLTLTGSKSKQIGGLADNLVRDLVTDDYGVIVMSSSMGQEVSIEKTEWGHGAFTKALVEGLAGGADANSDGTVYFHELDRFVTERVGELTGGQQHAVTMKPPTIRSFPLARQ